MNVRRVGGEAAAEVLTIVQAAFSARPALDPPGDALAESEESLRAALTSGGGLLAQEGGEPVGAMVLDPREGWLWMRRVGVLPGSRSSGVAHDLVRAAEVEAARLGCTGLRLIAREELPATVGFWQSLGYVVVERDSPYLQLAKRLPVRVELADVAATEALGRHLAGLLRAGDLVILTGGLGAGKTTLTKAIGAGLGVRGEVTSPTFVIARMHPGPLPLVHVDAYRLGEQAELDDLDLDADLEQAVTVVEWGSGLAEALSEDRVDVVIEVDTETETRTVTMLGQGPRWIDVDLVPQPS